MCYRNSRICIGAIFVDAGREGIHINHKAIVFLGCVLKCVRVIRKRYSLGPHHAPLFRFHSLSKPRRGWQNLQNYPKKTPFFVIAYWNLSIFWKEKKKKTMEQLPWRTIKTNSYQLGNFRHFNPFSGEEEKKYGRVCVEAGAEHEIYLTLIGPRLVKNNIDINKYK